MAVSGCAVAPFRRLMLVAGDGPDRRLAPHGCWCASTDCRRTFERSGCLELDRVCPGFAWRISVVVRRGHDVRDKYWFSSEAGRTDSNGCHLAPGGSEQDGGVDS